MNLKISNLSFSYGETAVSEAARRRACAPTGRRRQLLISSYEENPVSMAAERRGRRPLQDAGNVIFQDLSLCFNDDITCITGASGRGKTTLLRIIAGLITPQRGGITGVPGSVSFMFQEDRLLPWLTACKNVEAVLPKDRRNEAADLLDAMGLRAEKNSPPGELSGGQRRRVALARALAFDAKLLLLDEPFTGLDSETSARCAALVRTRGIPVIAALHSRDEIALLGGIEVTL